MCDLQNYGYLPQGKRVAANSIAVATKVMSRMSNMKLLNSGHKYHNCNRNPRKFGSERLDLCMLDNSVIFATQRIC